MYVWGLGAVHVYLLLLLLLFLVQQVEIGMRLNGELLESVKEVAKVSCPLVVSCDCATCKESLWRLYIYATYVAAVKSLAYIVCEFQC